MARAYKDGKPQTATSPNYAGRRLTVGLLVTSVVAFMTFASSTRSFAAKVNAQPCFTVLVFNFRQVPGPILANAENEAGRIFEHAGIHVTWRDCPTGDESCPKGAGPVFFLALMSGPVQNKFLGTVSGKAVATDRLAAVYYDYLPRITGGIAGTSDAATILGCVIAHELGHLLLGAHGHSITGIMKGQWDFEQTRRALMSRLCFLPEEAELMQGLLREGKQPGEAVLSALDSLR